MTPGKLILLFGNSDADALAWRARVNAAGGSVSQATYRGVAKFSRSCKAAGIWDKLNRVNLFCGDQLTAALVPLKVGAGSATDTNVNFVSGDYTEATGITGNGSSKYLNTGWSPVTASASLTSFSMGAYVSGIESAGTSRGIIGSGGAAGTNITILAWANAGTVEIGSIAATGAAQYSPSTSATGKQGFLSIVANGSRSQVYYANGSAVGTAVTSSGSFADFPFFVAANNGAGTPASYSLRAFRGYYIGTGMSASEMAAYNTIMETFQDSLSRGVQ